MDSEGVFDGGVGVDCEVGVESVWALVNPKKVPW